MNRGLIFLLNSHQLNYTINKLSNNLIQIKTLYLGIIDLKCLEIKPKIITIFEVITTPFSSQFSMARTVTTALTLAVGSQIENYGEKKS